MTAVKKRSQSSCQQICEVIKKTEVSSKSMIRLVISETVIHWTLHFLTCNVKNEVSNFIVSRSTKGNVVFESVSQTPSVIGRKSK